MWLLLLILSPVLALKTLEPSPSASRSGRVPIEGWVDVRLNHFNAANTATFPMRYYYNNEFASENIVIFVGGEWAISPGWVRSGLAYELAEATRAGLFYTEHRYYGLTRPTEDTGLEFLRFLTVDQALADLAQFIQYVKSDAFEAGRFRQAKVALVGCSYAGSMATWMRLAYPHLVDAVFSDSGPLHAQEDFPEYLEVITKAIRVQGGQNCLSSIEEAVQQLTLLLTTSDGPGQASQMFKTCSPINARSTLDLATFFWYGITETFAYLVQYAVPGDIPNACSVITNTSVANPVQRLANWITAQSWTQPCIETRYSEVVATHRNTSYASEKTTMRLWTYQTCVEFGWYQTTTSTRQPFLTTIPLEYFHQMCRDFFALNINENLLRAGIERTNLMFGGLSRLPDKVVTVMGSHDPWSPMGPNVDHQHHLAPVFVVPQISHCRAIRPTGDSETEELERTKVAVLQRMQSFVTGIDSGASELRAVASMVIVISVLAFI